MHTWLSHSFLQVVVEEQGVQDDLSPEQIILLQVHSVNVSHWHGEGSEAAGLTKAVAVVILVPPDAPTTILTRFSLSKMIVGHMDDSGLLPATQKEKGPITS